MSGGVTVDIAAFNDYLRAQVPKLSLIHISEPTRLNSTSRMPSSA